nr:hypothetical protein [Tanacetum cinerariifolium]
MSETIPPIPPPFGTSSGNPGSPNVNRVDTIPTTTDPINTMTTTNISQSIDEYLPQLLDSRGSSHVTNVPTFDKEDFMKVNATFVNSLPRKWLSMNQTQRANNSIKNDCLATLYGKYNYEEGLIDQIYESKTQRFSIQASSSKALICSNQFQDSDSDVEEEDEGTTRIRSFMAIAEDEPSVGKADARFGQ